VSFSASGSRKNHAAWPVGSSAGPSSISETFFEAYKESSGVQLARKINAFQRGKKVMSVKTTG
jgi:hypothetical protein